MSVLSRTAPLVCLWVSFLRWPLDGVIRSTGIAVDQPLAGRRFRNVLSMVVFQDVKSLISCYLIITDYIVSEIKF